MNETFVADMSDPDDRQRLWRFLKPLTGRIRFVVCAYRPRRSDRQNRYYWPCFVVPLAGALRENGIQVDGRIPTHDDAHDLLKHMFLPPKTYIRQDTGETMEIRGTTTTTLSTSEFNEYLDRCAAFLADKFSIVVPDPNEYHEKGETHADNQRSRRGARPDDQGGLHLVPPHVCCRESAD